MDFFNKYKYPIIGGIIGCIAALLIFILGFWKMLLLFVFSILGSLIGYYLKITGIIDHINKK